MANPVGGADEVIIIRFVADTAAALNEADRLQKGIDSVKKTLIELQAQSGKPFELLAAGLKSEGFNEYQAKLREIKKTRDDLLASSKTTPADVPQIKLNAATQIAEQQKAWSDYQKFVAGALASIVADEKSAAQAGADANNAFLNIQKNNTKQALEDKKQALAQEKEATKAAAEANTTFLNIYKSNLAQQKDAIKATNQALAEYISAWKDAQKTGEMGVMTQSAQDMGTRIQDLKKQIMDYATQNGVSLNKAAQDVYSKGIAPLNQMKQALRELNAEQGNTSKGGFLGFLQNLGSVGSYVFGTVFGITAITALRNVVRWFEEATKAGFEYAQALKRLEVSTQILQERGMNITMKETLELVTRLNQQFPIFTRKQVVEGVGYIQLLSQNLGLSTTQMENMNKVAAALGVVLGKDVSDAARELALFLSSGYGEALQRAGILASKAAVEQELLRMGIKESYNSVDQATRAQAGYNVIMRDAGKLVEKATDLQGDYAYSLTQTKTAWTELVNAFGIRGTPLLAKFLDWLTKALRVLNDVYGIASASYAQAAANFEFATILFVQSVNFLSNSLKNIGNPLYNFRDEAKKFLTDMIKVQQEILSKQLQFRLPDIFTGFTDSAADAAPKIQAADQKIVDAVTELHTKLLDAQKKFNEDMDALWTDYQRDLLQLTIDTNRKKDEAEAEYRARAYEIVRKMNDDFEAEETSYQNDIADINRDFATKKADAERKYRDAEYKAQKDFEEKMRRLREEFLFDLEDALRERDARQVLRLIRRFNLEQDRLNRERESQRDDRQRAYREELADIDRQKAERLRKLYEEHQARMLEIKRQEAIELRELEIKHKAEMLEIGQRLIQEQTDRQTRYEQQKADREAQYKNTLDELGAQLAAEWGLTAEMLNLITGEYLKTYGPDGLIPGIMNGFMVYLAQVNAEISRQIQAMAGMMAGAFTGSEPKGSQLYQPPASQSPSNILNPPYGYALGVQNKLFTSPTMIQVGEIPEVVDVTPVNRMNRSSTNNQVGKDGTITLELLLSPDLQARVIDNTLDQVANIMLDVQRRR